MGLSSAMLDRLAIKDTTITSMVKGLREVEGLKDPVATMGPTFETPAEIKLFTTMGADAVGMSTVPEAIIANALGMRVAGLSCICNWAAGISPVKLTHDDVTETANRTIPRMRRLIEAFLSELARENQGRNIYGRKMAGE